MMAIEHRDYPLTLNWECDPGLIREFGLRSTSTEQADAISGVLAALLIAAEAQRRVSYSRNRNWYVGRQRYFGPSFTYRNIIAAVDKIERAGLIEHQKARPGSRGLQSRMRASSALIEPARLGQVLHYRLHEALKLKNGDQLIPYRETAQTVRFRRELEEINSELGRVDVELPGVPRSKWHLWVNDNPILMTPRPWVHRVFLRGSWQCGGRLFGWWQTLPGNFRDQLRLNGEPVSRPDYCALHGQLLYAKRGAAMDGDIYDVGRGFSRDQGKLAFQIALNARDHRSAIAAIATHAKMARSRAVDLFDAVYDRNPRIADAFGSDAGVKLMRLDSEIMLGCLRSCASRQIPALPVHDELIVPAQYAGLAAEIMVQNFEARVFPVTPCQVRTK
jgi:hypothetical protein